MTLGLNKLARKSPAKNRAFSFMEILVVVTVLAIVAAVGIPVYGGVINASRREVAFTKARAVNAARASFAMAVPNANTQWTNAASDAARVQLLIDAQLLNGTAANYVTSEGGYTIQNNGAVRGSCTVMYGGSALAY